MADDQQEDEDDDKAREQQHEAQGYRDRRIPPQSYPPPEECELWYYAALFL